MNIPDGEYEIDLSVLGESSGVDIGTSSIALRYGFIPDSMDQSCPLTLFQEDELCILEAESVERVKLPPIIFEGIPQKQRPAQASSTLSPDSFFLSFSPAEKGSDGRSQVQLRRLDSTVRVNKSRNPEKWRASIKKWRSESETTLDLKNDRTVLEKREIPQPVKARSPHVSSPLLKRKPGRPPIKPGNNTKPPNETTRSGPTAVSHRASPASKRPPEPAVSEPKNDIISVSDFEDLESDDEAAFPVFETTSNDAAVRKEPVKAINGSVPKEVDEREERKSENSKVDSNQQTKIQKFPYSDDPEMDDEFADLEDQLDEVLDEKQQKKSTIVNSDSEDDSDSGAFVSTPIVIDTGDEKQAKRAPKLVGKSSQSKPMSLRSLYGGEKNDYLSSSEEE